MGTRHKVKVIIENEVIIDQYGQWDGHPTTAGEVIIDFLKNKDNIQFLKNIKNKFEYRKDEEQRKFVFGEMTMNPEKTYRDIYDFIYSSNQYFKNEETGEKVRWCDISNKQLVDEVYKKFGYESTAYYMMITRDTGYNVLDTIKELNRLEPDKKIPIFKSDYEGWDIEARYTINLDDNTLKMQWHDETQIYDLENLPNEEEIKEFEEEKIEYEEMEAF